MSTSSYPSSMTHSNTLISETSKVREREHLPYFVRKTPATQLLGVGVRCGSEEGSQLITLTVRWLDSSLDTQERWARINNSVTHHATTSPSLHGMLICDGPCRGIVDYTKMMEYPDCGHKICKRCQFNELSVPNADGSPGCCVPTCVRQTLINRVPLGKYRKEAREHGTPFLGVQQSSPTNSANASAATDFYVPSKINPTELLHVRVLILERLQSRIVRQKLERELPSDYNVDYVFDIIKERIGFTNGVKVYFTNASSIHGREELIPLPNTLENGRRTLLSLSGGRSTLTFVATKPGVRIFKQEK
ncbi:unnamed protein product [Cylicocyclus nassatus]|uniref:Uncharacterized protein n=1 Tax=Cylicocyclus nassatus TaxID=53992 RepID=A0AA36GJS7_CYLNA|nr:unnamed protein product [Cylicocyclus nassatus]